MVGNRVGPCPTCGAIGLIIDGVYSVREVAGRLITTLRDLSRGEVTEDHRRSAGSRTRNEAQFDAAVDRLPEEVRCRDSAVVEKESAKSHGGVRWALIAEMILTILLWMYPDEGQKAGQAVDQVVQSTVSGVSSVPDTVGSGCRRWSLRLSERTKTP